MPVWYLPNGALVNAYATTATTTTSWPLYATIATATSTTAPWITWASNGNLLWQTTVPSPAEQWQADRRRVDRMVNEYLALEHRVMAESAARSEQRTLLRRQAESAKRRARDLLLEHLSEAQRETFIKHKWFVVENVRTKNRYRIRERDSLVANIDVMDSGKYSERVMHRLCGHLDLQTIPLHDHLLAQKLSLEFDEDAFLRIANRHAA